MNMAIALCKVAITENKCIESLKLVPAGIIL